MRKVIHLSTAGIPAAGWLLSFEWAVALSSLVLAGSLALEAGRRWWPWANHLLWRLIPSVFRESEDRRVLGSTWLAFGMLATLILFGQDVGGTALLFSAWGDPAAEVVGRKWGPPAQKKTTAGSLGCLAACVLAACVGIWLGALNPWAALVGAGVATAVERWSPPPDDNLWMPLLSGLAIVLVQRYAGK